MATVADRPVPQVPQDTVSSLSFGTYANTPVLASGSWSKKVSVWTLTAQGIAPATAYEHEAPVLSVQCDSANGLIFSAGCDNVLRAFDPNANQSIVVGQHAAAIKDCRLLPSLGAVVTGGWDKAVRYWDPRSQTKAPVAELALPGKVYSMDAAGNLLVIGMENRLVGCVDVRNPTAFFETAETPHEFQTRVVGAMPNDMGYATGSIEGRAHIKYFGALADKSFPFRCHRSATGNISNIFPVTSLSFHPSTGALATTGNEEITMWNHIGKVSINTHNPKQGPISTGVFSPDGSMYAYACSYDWSLGANGPGRQQPHKIFVKSIRAADVATTPA